MITVSITAYSHVTNSVGVVISISVTFQDSVYVNGGSIFCSISSKILTIAFLFVIVVHISRIVVSFNKGAKRIDIDVGRSSLSNSLLLFSTDRRGSENGLHLAFYISY